MGIVGDQFNTGNAGELLVVETPVGDMGGDHVPDMVHLDQTDGRIDIVHRVLVSHLCNVVFQPTLVLGKAEPPKFSGPFHLRTVLHRKEAPVNGGHMLDGLEGKDGIIGVAADHPGTIPRAEGVGGVLDERNSGFTGNGIECVQVADHTGIMDQHDGSGPGRNMGTDAFRGQETVPGVNVAPDHLGACHGDGRVGWLGRHRGADDFVSGFDARQNKRQMKGIRPSVDGNDVFVADVFLEPVLKVIDRLASGDISAIQNIL